MSDEPAREVVDEKRPRRGSRRRRRQRQADNAWFAEHGPTVVKGLLAVTVVGSLLAIGAVHVPTAIAASLFAVAAAAVSLALPTRARWVVPAPAWVALALGGFTLLQAAPMPMSLLETIAPANADVWANHLRPFGEPAPRWASISMDPGASAVEALKWIGYAAAMIAAAGVASRSGAAWCVSLVFLAAVAAAAATLGHGLANAKLVFGIYEPKFDVSRWNVGPLLNENNLSGYLNVGLLAGLGLFLSRSPPLPRPLMGLCIGALVGMCVLSGSRGGVLGLALGIVLFAVIVVRASASRRTRLGVSRNSAYAAVGATFAGGIALALLGARNETWRDLFDKNAEKLAMTGWAKPVVADHPWLGVGRGAFENMFAAYRPKAGHKVYPYLENFAAQWIVDWGVPVAILALLAFAWTLRPRELGTRSSIVAAAAAAGVVVLLVQNTVDLGLEVPAVMLMLFTLLGALWGGRHYRKTSAPRPLSGIEWKRALPFAAAGVVVAVLASLFGLHPVAAERRELHAAYRGLDVSDRAATAAFRERLRAAMHRHPGEAYFPLLGALTAWRSKSEDPIRWLNRALERDAYNSRAHLLLARVLRARGATSQALLELRLAAEADANIYLLIGRLAAKWGKDLDEMMRAVPEGQSGVRVLAVLCQELPRGDSEERLRCLKHAMERDPQYQAPYEVAARDVIREVSKGDSSKRCGGERRDACIAEAQGHIQKLQQLPGGASSTLSLRAELLLAQGQAKRAEKLLSEGCGDAADPVPCLRLRYTAALEADSPELLEKATRALSVAACPPADLCARTQAWMGAHLADRKSWTLAMARYARAAEEDPTRARFLRLADVAAKAGAHSASADALIRAKQLPGGDDEALERDIESQKTKSVRQLFTP